MTPAKSPPDWLCLHLYALEPANLPRVLAGMGFDRAHGPMPRGGVPVLARPPQRHLPWRQRLAASNTVAASGLFAGRWARESVRSAQDANCRARVEVEARNALWAAMPCRLMVRESGPPRAVYVCQDTGEWADARGGARGESLVALGAYMWGLSFGRAGWRLARLCGLPAVPVVRHEPPGAGGPLARLGGGAAA